MTDTGALCPEGPSTHLGTVHRAQGPWAETVTWDSAPSLAAEVAELGNTESFPTPGRARYESTWVTADVSSVVDGNGSYDFYVVNELDIVGSVFSSREGEHPPILVVTYEYTDEPAVPLPTP